MPELINVQAVTEMLEELIRTNRSYRRFQQKPKVTIDDLRWMVDLARHSASAANRQPLRYLLSCDPDRNSDIFACLSWAGYLPEWPGPADEERPTGYIVVLADTRISKNWFCDDGIASQSILLGARERGFGGCMLAAIDRKRLRRSLAIPDHLEILLVLALGAPGEEVVLEPLPDDGSVRYWRDDKGVHHVPKRDLNEFIVGEWA